VLVITSAAFADGMRRSSMAATITSPRSLGRRLLHSGFVGSPGAPDAHSTISASLIAAAVTGGLGRHRAGWAYM
jgi:hypothetical protein